MDDANRKIAELAQTLNECDSLIIGAGAGLSTAAGLTYTGERFERYFGDFAAKYPFRDMYSGGFYPYESLEEHWAYWSRYIWINRYAPILKGTYDKLLDIIGSKDHFVLTTNVDHCFQRAGFDKERLFYTQGDYGLFQCSKPCYDKTWDNYDAVKTMVKAQGFIIENDGALTIPEGVQPSMVIPSDLVPECPECGGTVSMNLRADDSFVEDDGWKRASARYSNFVKTRSETDGDLLLLELGVGANTPAIIKYPFWQMTMKRPNTTYACVNLGDAYAPFEIADRSICIDADIDEVLDRLCDREDQR